MENFNNSLDLKQMHYDYWDIDIFSGWTKSSENIRVILKHENEKKNRRFVTFEIILSRT